MPLQRTSSQNSRNITEFFRPFAKSKARLVLDEVVHENIIVADRRTASATPTPAVKENSNVVTKPQQDASHTQTPSPSPPASVMDTVAGSSNDPPSTLVSFTSRPPTAKAEERPAIRLLSLSPSLSPVSSPPPLPSLPPPRLAARMIAEAHTSFNSTSTLSTLSTLPFSSQSSSKRTVKDGMLAVTNSDSESHDDDSDPLDDIDELIRRKRLKMSPTEHSETPVVSKDDAPRELRSSRRERPTDRFRKPSSPPKKVYRFSLASLVKESAKEAALEEKLKQYEREHSRNDHVHQHQNNAIEATGALGRLAERLEQDTEGAEEKGQLMQAMKRMDALQKEVRFRFYMQTATEATERPFPVSALTDSAWATLLNDHVSREAAFRSGFAADIVRIQPLPDGVIEWILQELLHEKQPELGHAYVSILKSSLLRFPHNLVSTRSELLRKSLLKVAGREEFLPTFEDGRQKVPVPVGTPGPARPPFGLRWCAMLIGRLADRLTQQDKCAWLALLMISLIDENVQAEPSTTAELQETIVSLLSSVDSPDLDNMIKHTGTSILSSISNPILIHRLLIALPSTTAPLHKLKRRLALCAFTKSRDYWTDPLSHLAIFSALTSYLSTSPKFKIRETTDFAVLGARFAILDIAIGAGFSDFPFLPLLTVDATTTTTTTTSAEESAFNNALDGLVAQVRRITSQIRDAGAAHMRRTECKGVMERLASRLEFAVRTRVKPRSGIFGGGERKIEGEFFQRVG